jgi:pyridoxine/pyridoxamine 5'-phosphate oxidase
MTNTNKLEPVRIYNNAESQKGAIIEENRGKSGVYRWTNLENGSSYIGSSVNLGKRLNLYYNSNYLTKVNMIIHKALNKHKHSGAPPLKLWNTVINPLYYRENNIT